MSCRNTEVKCSLRFCASCVEDRYVGVTWGFGVSWFISHVYPRYDFRFDAESRLFICPVCQGYCNCWPCLDKDKVAEKLHLGEIMEGTEDESHRILKKYKNVQKFLEAMGAAKAPPVPRTVLHVARIVRKAEDKQSAAIPQEIYHGLMKPERMDVTYRSMISLAGPITWAFPKKPSMKKRKQRQTETLEGDFADESRSDSDDFGETEKRERKRARLHHKKSKPGNPAAAPIPAGPFEFEFGPDGQIQLDHNGDPVINAIISPNTTPYGKKSSSKRNNKKQVTFSEELDPSLGAWPGAEHDVAPPSQQDPSSETLQQTVEYIQQQLDRHQQQKDNPAALPDFQLDPALKKLFEEDARSGQMARHIMEGGDVPWEEPPREAFHLDPPSPRTLQRAIAATSIDRAQPRDTQQAATNGNILVEEDMSSPRFPFSSHINADDRNFDDLAGKVQHFPNDSPGDELDAIFGVFTNATAEVQDGQDDDHVDIDIEVGCMSNGEI